MNLGQTIKDNFKEATQAVIKTQLMQKKCFQALGKTGAILRDQLVPALHGMEQSRQRIDHLYEYMRETYEKAGMFK